MPEEQKEGLNMMVSRKFQTSFGVVCKVVSTFVPSILKSEFMAVDDNDIETL